MCCSYFNSVKKFTIVMFVKIIYTGEHEILNKHLGI